MVYAKGEREMRKKEMLEEMKMHNWGDGLTMKNSFEEIEEEYNTMIDECLDDSNLFPNGRDYDAEDEDGPF